MRGEFFGFGRALPIANQQQMRFLWGFQLREGLQQPIDTVIRLERSDKDDHDCILGDVPLVATFATVQIQREHVVADTVRERNHFVFRDAFRDQHLADHTADRDQ